MRMEIRFILQLNAIFQQKFATTHSTNVYRCVSFLQQIYRMNGEIVATHTHTLIPYVVLSATHKLISQPASQKESLIKF